MIKCFLQQGEGAPIVRKGTCANHIRDVEKLLKGAHITITARSEDDVEVDAIMGKLARATASAYKFNEPRGENEGHTGPIGTTYRRYIFTFSHDIYILKCQLYLNCNLNFE